jgi:uncharacterized membrane protein HdeD (DUF308 family)
LERQISLYIYGLIIILMGIFFMFSEQFSIKEITIIIGILAVTGAFFAFLTALSNPKKRIELAYHEIHAFSMIIYGGYIIFFSSTLDSLIGSTVFLFIFYMFSEIAFCISIFNKGQKVLYKIMVIRLVLGLFAGIAAVRILNFESIYDVSVLIAIGIIFIVLGTNILIYVPILKKREAIMYVGTKPKNEIKWSK